MRRLATLAVIGLAVTACGGSAGETTTTSAPTATTTTTTTTTTLDPAELTAETCDRIKVASFDLERNIQEGLGAAAAIDPEEVDEEAMGLEMVAAIVAFYDEVGAVAEVAPEEIVDDLTTISSSVDPWREAVEAGDTELFSDLDPATLTTSAVQQSIDRVAAWTTLECGGEISLAPEQIVFGTVFGALFGALGDTFGDLGEAFGEGFEGGEFGEIDTSAVTYGDDPVLDALWDGCEAGNPTACDDLYWQSFGEYELFGQTCGGRVPFRSAFSVDCEAKLDAAGPSGRGDDVFLDSMWDDCTGGDEDACDSLFGGSPIGSEYEHFGSSCGGRRSDDSSNPCAFLASGEPFGYGDDPDLDALWDSCSVEGGSDCDDLFFSTPIGSAYESFGDTCGDLMSTGRTCALTAELLGGPVG